MKAPKSGLLGLLLSGSLILSGCGDSENFVFTNTNQGPGPQPVVAPVAVDDNYNALGNSTVSYNAASGVLVNDTLNGGEISAFDSTGDQGGTLTLNDDGSFTYTPVFGFTGTENFSYTLSNSEGDSSAEVTFSTPNSAFFVDNSGSNGNGAQSSPFDNLTDALAAADSGDTVFVLQGDGTTQGLTGPFTLPNGVSLVGEGAGLVVAQTVVPAGDAPVLVGPITCEGSNTIAGITLDGQGKTVGPGVIIDSVSDVTIDDCNFRDHLATDIDLDDAGGTILIQNSLFDFRDGNPYFTLQNTDVDVNISVLNNIFQDGDGSDPTQVTEIIYAGTSSGEALFEGNTIENLTDPDNGIDDGIELVASGTGVPTLTIRNNTFRNLDNIAVCTFADQDGYNATIEGNLIESPGENAFKLQGRGGTVTIDNNRLEGIADTNCGIEIFPETECLFVLTNNFIDTTGDDAVSVSDNGGDLRMALRDNTFTNLTNEAIDITVVDSIFCLDITGNTFGDDIRLEETGSGELNVERLDDGLQNFNTFQPGVVVNEVGGNIVSRDAGFCQIP